jgi:regulator of sigma E protease
MEFLFLASFGEVMSYIGYILLALLILLIMITVHELGHYIAGKIFKFGIDEFAIGFGPKLFSRKRKSGEVFSIRLLPIGGFCAFKGEDKDSEDPSAFNNKKPWQRIIVLISGALMNYLTALLVIMLMFGIYGQTALMSYKTSPTTEYTQEYCLQDRDVLLAANGKSIYLTTDIMSAIGGRQKGDEVTFTVIRGGKVINTPVKLRADTNFKNVEDTKTMFDALGIYYDVDQNGAMVDAGLYSTSVRHGFFKTIGMSFEYSFKLAGTIFIVLGQLITGALGLGSLGGTVTTISVTANAIRIGGMRYFMNMLSFIGVNLAVFNLLPIPALDGSRVVFTGIEWIRKKPLNRRVEGIIHAVGLVCLLLFSVLVDIGQCV